MDRHPSEGLSGCCVQVTPESMDVYMKPPSTTAASFCMRGIGWKKTSQRAIDGAAHPRHRAPPDTRPTDRLRPSTCVDRGGCTHAFIVTPTTGMAATAVVGEAGARHVPRRRPRTQWIAKTVTCCRVAASRSHPSPWMCKHNRHQPQRRVSVCVYDWVENTSERAIDGAASPSCPPDTRPTGRRRPSTCGDRGGCTHTSLVTPTTGIAAAPVVGEAGARHVPCRRPRTQWTSHHPPHPSAHGGSRSHPGPPWALGWAPA